MEEILLTEKDMVFLVLLYFHGRNNTHNKYNYQYKKRTENYNSNTLSKTYTK